MSGMPLNEAALAGAGGQEDFGDDYGEEGDEPMGAGNPLAAIA